MPEILYTDLETWNRHHDVTKVGADVYSRTSRPLIATWAWNDEPVQLWQRGDDPTEYKAALACADKIIAHNAWFEHNNLREWGWCTRPVSAWHCTMAQAYVHCMPGSLDALARFLGAPPDMLKITGGKRLIHLFCKPQRGGRRILPADRPEEWQRFCHYAIGDTGTLRWVHKHLPRVNLHE